MHPLIKDLLTMAFMVFLLLSFILLGYGAYLQYRFAQPFRLVSATTKEKWTMSAKIIFCMMSPLFVGAVFYPIITPEKNQPWWLSLVCIGFCLPAYLFMVLAKMANFAYAQMNYRWVSSAINKNREVGQAFSLINTLILDKETRQFFNQGFPENIVEGVQRDINSLSKETPIHHSTFNENQWNLTVYGPTAESPVFYAFFQAPSISETHLIPFGYFSPVNQCRVNWNIGKQVCGISIDGKYYVLFHNGAGSVQRSRVRFRLRKNNAFSDSYINWFLSVTKNGEIGLY